MSIHELATFGKSKTELSIRSSFICNLSFHDESFGLDHDCNECIVINTYNMVLKETDTKMIENTCFENSFEV